jgi:hypothetical protein
VYRRCSGDLSNTSLSLYFGRRLGLCRQLQHRRVLTLAQPGEPHDLPVGALQGVMMRVWLLHLDLPEKSYLLSDDSLTTESKKTFAFRFRLERDLCAGKKTQGYLRFSD